MKLMLDFISNSGETYPMRRMHRTLGVTIAVLMLTLFVAMPVRAVTADGFGRAAIDNGNLRDANIKAENDAIANAIASYFDKRAEENPGTEVPDVTDEYFKFVKKYRILSRTVNDSAVLYHIEADIDDVALNDISYFVENFTNSAIYYTRGVPGAVELEFDSAWLATLKDHQFTTRAQKEYRQALPNRPYPSDLMRYFGSSGAQYLFLLTLETQSQGEEDATLCAVNLTTKVFSRTQELPSMKAEGRASSEDEDTCIVTASEQAINNTLDYIRENLIELPANSGEQFTYTLSISGFANFIKIEEFTTALKNRRIATDMTTTHYSPAEVRFKLTSPFSPESFRPKLDGLATTFSFRVQEYGESIKLDFAPNNTERPEPASNE